MMKRYILVREKLRKIAKERGYGMRQRRYWYKEGAENRNAKKIRVIDVIKGVKMEGIVKEIVLKVEGSSSGIWYAMKNDTRYKGRYIIKENKMGNKEVILEDTKTGEIRVLEQKKVPELTGGTKMGVIKAMKKGNKYKGR